MRLVVLDDACWTESFDGFSTLEVYGDDGKASALKASHHESQAAKMVIGEKAFEAEVLSFQKISDEAWRFKVRRTTPITFFREPCL